MSSIFNFSTLVGIVASMIFLNTSETIAQNSSTAHDPAKFTFVRLKWEPYTTLSPYEQQQHNWNIDGLFATDGPMKGMSAEKCLLSSLELATNGKVRVNQEPLSLSILEMTENKGTAFAFAFMTEVGWMKFQDEEVKPMRNWLDRGGFLMTDDFHGPFQPTDYQFTSLDSASEWQRWALQLKRLYPELDIASKPIAYSPELFREARQLPRSKRGPPRLLELTSTHPVFNTFYSFSEIPHIYGLRAEEMGQKYEYGGDRHRILGLFSPEGRLMILMNYNMDVGDGLERCVEMKFENPYTKQLVPDGLKLGINYVIYSLTR